MLIGDLVADRLAQLQDQLKRTAQQLAAREVELAKPPPGPATNLKQAALGEDASAHDLLSAMKEILIARCPERPYNGLKKALAAVAEVPGKVSPCSMPDGVLRSLLTHCCCGRWRSRRSKTC
jgi:hypothetical protein